MNTERQQVVVDAARLRDESPSFDYKMPSTAAIVAASNLVPTGPGGPAVGLALTQRVMYGVLTAARRVILLSLNDVTNAPAVQRKVIARLVSSRVAALMRSSTSTASAASLPVG
jgi:hypothetical protein